MEPTPARSRFARLLRPGSVRTQLIAVNVVALSLLLSALGFTVRYSVKRLMMQSIDRELSHRGHGPGGHGGQHNPHDGGGNGDIRNRTNGAAGQANTPDNVRDNAWPGGQPGGGDGSQNPPPPNQSGDGQQEDHGPAPGPDNSDQPDTAGGANGGRDNRGGRRPGPPPQDEGPYRPALFGLDGKSLDPHGRTELWDADAFAATKAEASRGTLAPPGIQHFSTVTVDGAQVRVLTVARRDPRFTAVIAQLPYPLTDVYRALEELDRALLWMIPVGLLFASIGGWYLTGRVLHRITWMTDAAATMGAGDLSRRLPADGDDEFSTLARTFNGMLSRLEQVFSRQNALLDQQRRFTADASHELKTPLTIIKGNTSLAISMGQMLTKEDCIQSMHEIDTAANSMSSLVQDLLLLARSDSGLAAGTRTVIAASEILSEAIKTVKPRQDVIIDFMPPDEDVTVYGNQQELVRVFKNLLDNAITYSTSGGMVHLMAQRTGSMVAFTVRDHGDGIAPEHLEHLGERFYRIDTSRTRPTGGTGLGLSIVKGIVEAHQGTLTFESEVGKGTQVTVSLPAEPIEEPTQ
jgi:signal transduction histidine kinase